MATKRRAIVAIFVCTFFMAAGATLFKIGADTTPAHFLGIVTHQIFYYAVLVYAIGAVCLVWGLKHGELSVLYPIVGLNFAWVVFMAVYLIGEPMNWNKLTGTIMILIGVAFMGQETIRKRWKLGLSWSRS